MTRHMTVLMTAPTEEEAVKIAKRLTEEKLCACVSIVPGIRSIYRWEGKIQDEQEVMMVAKTASSMAPALVAKVKEMHSYRVPEVVCLPVETGNGDYLDWIEASVDIPTDAEEEGEL